MTDFEDINFDDILNDGFNIVAEEITISDLNVDNDKNSDQNIFPILPVRNMVMFPNVVIPITAGRKNSIQLLEEAQKNGEYIGIVSQKNSDIEQPSEKDLYQIGTLAKIIKIIKLPEGNITAITKGIQRFKIKNIVESQPYFRAEITKLKDVKTKNKEEYEAILDNIKDLALKIIELDPNIPNAANFAIKNISNHDDLLNFISTNANFPYSEKQKLLEEKSLMERANKCYSMMHEDFRKLELRNQIHQKTSKDLDKQQREYFLNQQIKAIQDELGGGPESDVEDLIKKSKTKKWNEEVEEHFQKEINRLQRQNPNSPDYNVQRNYLDFFTDLPWETFTKDSFDIEKAQKVLDKAHFGLEDIKKRILEHMAVLKLRNDMKSPIICLYGPPGVGKTSVGKSIADALGREYVRFSLGGLRDEAEIRGHRKTYIGAMPGRILQNIKKAKTSNPVFVLDEIDKLSSSHNGDPSSALLEVLDPAQNKEFYDNFLEIGYDLSKVMFIATSNSLNTIQPALLDRMEIIEMNGYTIEEKVEIAKQHLLPKQLKEHGLDAKSIQLGKKQLEFIITKYTRESGVRSLDKQMASVARFVAKSIVMEEEYAIKPTDEDIIKMLGAPKFEADKYENNETAGVVTGLAWTRVGGDILYIESIVSEGKGTLTMTGNLGNVMKESATIALEYIKSNAKDLGIDPELFSKYKIHVHVPEGATPKDGPSAGIAMLTSMVSSFTQKRIKKNLAMTGEITLRGKVLPVGGIKEKILAAKRANIKEIILCSQNKRDIEQINQDYLTGLTFHYVDTMQEVIKLAITDQNVKNAKKL